LKKVKNPKTHYPKTQKPMEKTQIPNYPKKVDGFLGVCPTLFVMDTIDEVFRVTIDSGNFFDLYDLLFRTQGYSDKAADLC
jgi:hypothetical protein